MEYDWLFVIIIVSLGPHALDKCWRPQTCCCSYNARDPTHSHISCWPIHRAQWSSLRQVSDSLRWLVCFNLSCIVAPMGQLCLCYAPALSPSLLAARLRAKARINGPMNRVRLRLERSCARARGLEWWAKSAIWSCYWGYLMAARYGDCRRKFD